MEIPRHKLKSGDDSTRVVNVRDNSERAFYKGLSLNCLMSFLRFLMPVIPWHAFIIICHLHNPLHCLWP
ncbi:hypothetical protein Bca52824_014663 [Brassica carinata]|uniref:Uncharacterized protein n=1 Tax=Brassica carinata TaxID=52824 RepID=A0A8X7W3C1_BRACI|nr:hypothetical protein Bca52824_014663 [Brassica carinata]